MLNIVEFIELITPLSELFDPLNDEQQNIYFERLKRHDYFLLKRAVEYLEDTYNFKTFPKIADFHSAVDQVSKERNEATAEELDDGRCDKCNDIGGTIHPVLHLGKDYDVFFPCECRKGRIYKKAFDNVKNKRGFLTRKENV